MEYYELSSAQCKLDDGIDASLIFADTASWKDQQSRSSMSLPLMLTIFITTAAYNRQHPNGEGWAHRAAWKYLGYPELSKRLASSDEHLMFRKFGTLNVRVLLKLQDEIVQLERELNRMDNFTKEAPGGGCGSLRLDASTPRGHLLDELRTKLQEYNVQLKSFLEIQEQPVASKAQIHDLQEWLEDRPNIVEEPEQEFSECEDDLITARPHSQSSSRWWPQRSSNTSRCESATMSRVNSACARDSELFAPGGSVISTAEVLMLVSPAWAMAFTCGETERIVIWGLFTVWFVGLAILNKRMTVRNRFVAVAGYLSMVVIMLCLTPTCPQSMSLSQAAFASTSTSCCARQTSIAEARLRRAADISSLM